jgi:DNA polymerase IIIc chi subunit
LSEKPWAIAASDFIEHGATTIASAANEPLAIAAPLADVGEEVRGLVLVVGEDEQVVEFDSQEMPP